MGADGSTPTNHLSVAVESSGDAIIAVDLNNRITAWNQGAELLYGHAEEHIIGQELKILLAEDQTKEIYQLLHQVFNDGRVVSAYRSTGTTVDGFHISVHMSMAPIYDADHVIGASLVIRDASESERVQEKLNYLEDYNSVTDMHNRNWFVTELERFRETGPGCVLIVDINNFKLINDSYTHQTGNAILSTISKQLKLILDEQQSAHFGGDEFAMVISGVEPDACALADSLTEELEKSIWEQFHIRAAFSVGVCAYEVGDSRSVEELLVCADIALFDAKEKSKGRNSVSVYDADNASVLNWAEKIHQALDNGRLVLYAQPIMDLASGKIVQQELLLRMNDPEEGIVSPGPFLMIAERLGLINEIDRWVVKQGIAFAETGQAVEINLSGNSMTDAGVLELIAAELKSSGVDPKTIAFEITETAAIANIAEATHFAQQLSQLGCQFALDDFGTGFGSFIYLKHLPVSILKIDGEFIRNLSESEIDQRIVQAIVFIAKGLKMKVVAEWVEDQKTLDLLKEWKVDYAQGYFVGRPEPIKI